MEGVFNVRCCEYHKIARAVSWLDFTITVATSWVTRVNQLTDLVLINKHHKVEPQTSQPDTHRNNFAHYRTQLTVACSQLITSRQLTVGQFMALKKGSTPSEILYSDKKKEKC